MTKKEKISALLKQIVRSNRLLYAASMTLLGKRPIANALAKEIHGKGNIIIKPSTVIFRNCKVDIIGDNNEIDISDFCSFNNVTFLIRGDNNRIKISKAVKFNYGGSLHIEDEDCLIQIGKYTTFEEVHIAVTEPGSRIQIGADCMFAYDIDLRTGDSHSIIDTKTNRRINYAKNILIDDHVWVAPHCSILKGVHVRKNCVVATRTVLTKTVEQEGVIIGGSPCRILKANVTWDRQRISTPEQVVADKKIHLNKRTVENIG